MKSPGRGSRKPKLPFTISPDQSRLAAVLRGSGAFELDLLSYLWVTMPQVAILFGFDPGVAKPSFHEWQSAIFSDDRLKLRAAIEAAPLTGTFGVEIRVTHPDRSVHWLAVEGEVVADSDGQARWLRGTWHEISDRKALEIRLLGLTETLEARIAELADEARVLEILNRTGIALAAELDLECLLQTVTDAGVSIAEAQFGAFFYNVDSGDSESYTLYTIAGVPREVFAGFPMPRNTAIFSPTFRGLGPVRSNDILTDARYGKNPPYHGMPKGHLPVRSYLAVPVVSRLGEVVGGLFFGHAEPGVFTERAERLILGIASQAAIAIDNARLYQKSQQAEQALNISNATLGQRVNERAQQLELSFGALRESERRFRLLVEAVTDYAIFMLDHHGHVIKWNPGAERLKGYTEAEIIGEHFSRFYTEEDREAGLPDSVIARARTDGKFEGEEWRVRKDGSRFWANVVVHAIYEHNQLIGFAKVTRDLTTKRASEEQLRQAQKMESLGQLTGGIAHDFNNLLTVISGNIEALQRRLAERGDENLGRLAKSALLGSSRAAILTHQLLAFARRQPLEPRIVSVNMLISGLSDMLRRTIPERIAIETVLAGGVWSTFVDANQLENCLLNLAVNSRDAMPDGGRLTIEAANVYLDDNYATAAEVPAGQYVGIFVSDTGVGMVPDVVAKAFDPFFTTKDIGQGTGLGLSQVYGFVKQSGGHVKIYSEPGAGTTIKIYLPRLLSAEGTAAEAPPVSDPPRGSGETILVVEDEAEVRSFSSEALEELGYRVLEAPDGSTALRLISRHPEIALMFTDVGLPGGMNGRQLADQVRRVRPDLKVLFTSGYARNAIVHHGRLDPGVQLLMKPFTFADLAMRIRQTLDQHV
jgi:PAS domain S-box-containing protein